MAGRVPERPAPQVPDGSADIPLRWGGLPVASGALALIVTGGVLVAKRLFVAEQP